MRVLILVVPWCFCYCTCLLWNSVGCLSGIAGIAGYPWNSVVLTLLSYLASAGDIMVRLVTLIAYFYWNSFALLDVALQVFLQIRTWWTNLVFFVKTRPLLLKWEHLEVAALYRTWMGGAFLFLRPAKPRQINKTITNLSVNLPTALPRLSNRGKQFKKWILNQVLEGIENTLRQNRAYDVKDFSEGSSLFRSKILQYSILETSCPKSSVIT